MLAVVLLVAGLAVLPAAAQGDRPRDGNANNNAPPQYTFGDNDTSLNNTNLENLIERFPEADKDGDGILDAEEGRALVRELNKDDADRRRREQLRGPPKPTHADIAYGPGKQHVIDLYLAESDKPTPLVVYFHGGQFITGDEDDLGTLDVRALLRAGISVASVDYRDTNLTPFPAPFEDAAKAVQFLRTYAAQYNLDPERIAGHGEEAGGNLALYLGLHDDLATQPREVTEEEQKQFDELIARTFGEKQIKEKPDTAISLDSNSPSESAGLPQPNLWDHPQLPAMSTRLSCVVARHPIASFDPRAWEKNKLPMNDHERLMTKYLGVRSLEPFDDEKLIALVEDVSPLALVSSDDPDVLLMSQYPDLELADDTVWTIMAHHPRQSELIAKAMRAKGNRATVRYRGMPNDPGTSSVQFFIDKLKR